MDQKAMEIRQGRELLAERGWLREAEADFKTFVLANATWRSVPNGTTIGLAGDEQGPLFGIARGTIEISIGSAPAGSGPVHLAHAGFWAGYRPSVTGSPRTVSCVARGPVLVAMLRSETLLGALKTNAHWWREIARLAEDNANTAVDALADLSIPDSERRAIAVILRVGGCRHVDPPEGTVVEIRVGREQLATMANMSRNTLGSILGRLEDLGMLTPTFGGLVVRDITALRARVEGNG